MTIMVKHRFNPYVSVVTKGKYVMEGGYPFIQYKIDGEEINQPLKIGDAEEIIPETVERIILPRLYSKRETWYEFHGDNAVQCVTEKIFDEKGKPVMEKYEIETPQEDGTTKKEKFERQATRNTFKVVGGFTNTTLKEIIHGIDLRLGYDILQKKGGGNMMIWLFYGVIALGLLFVLWTWVLPALGITGGGGMISGVAETIAGPLAGAAAPPPPPPPV